MVFVLAAAARLPWCRPAQACALLLRATEWRCTALEQSYTPLPAEGLFPSATNRSCSLRVQPAHEIDELTLLQWGLLERRRGRPEAAATCFSRGVKAAPRNPYLWQVGMVLWCVPRTTSGLLPWPCGTCCTCWLLQRYPRCERVLKVPRSALQVYGVLLFAEGRQAKAREVLRQGV